MRIEERSGRREREILIWLITNDAILEAVQAKWRPKVFPSLFAQYVADWCVDYFAKYGQAPRKQIQSLFETWSDANKEHPAGAVIERFLASLSDEYEQTKEINTSWAIDRVGEFFDKQLLRRTIERAEEALAAEDVQQAIKTVNAFERVAIGQAGWIDVFDLEEHQQTLKTQERTETLFRYPGDLGQFFGDAFQRDAFLAFMAPEKRGKSFWLLDVAYRAVRSRRRVLYFEAGDMSKAQVLARLQSRLCKRPHKPQTIRVPTRFTESLEDPLEYEERDFSERLSIHHVKQAYRNLRNTRLKSNKPYWRLSCHPTSTLTIADILLEIRAFIRKQWVPDVVILDYADILAMDAKQDFRHATNEIWKGLRRISQEFHCLVVTATQADAKSYTKELLDQSNFSEDKRKFAHITGMVGINATDQDRGNGVFRLNWLARRSEEYQTRRTVRTASCLPLANPAVLSSF